MQSELDPNDAALVDAVGRVALGFVSPAEMAAQSGIPVAMLGPYAPEPSTGSPAERSVELSVAVAAFNEAEVLSDLWRRLEPVLRNFDGAEVIIVDDGSTDRTWDAIARLAAADPRIHGIRLSRNFGQQAALTVALEAATGRAVACVDADLQDPPELLTEMVERWREGCEVIYAVRRRRTGSLPKRVAYRAFYGMYRRLADIDVPLHSGDFAVLDRRVVDEIVALPERTRFLRGLRSWVGFRQEPFEYDRPARAAGRPGYTFAKLRRLAVDGLVSFSVVPLRAASILGLVVATMGAIYVGVALVTKLLSDGVPRGWTSTMAAILLLGGAQLTVIGVLGEYVARIYEESKRRPHAVIQERTERAGGC